MVDELTARVSGEAGQGMQTIGLDRMPPLACQPVSCVAASEILAEFTV